MTRRFDIKDELDGGINTQYESLLQDFFELLRRADIKLTDEEFISIVNLQPSQSCEVKIPDGNLTITRIS